MKVQHEQTDRGGYGVKALQEKERRERNLLDRFILLLSCSLYTKDLL
jgi:hypothetical protein